MRVDPFGGEERKTLDRECGFVAPESEREEEAVRTYISNAIPRRDACKRKKSSRTNHIGGLPLSPIQLAFGAFLPLPSIVYAREPVLLLSLKWRLHHPPFRMGERT